MMATIRPPRVVGRLRVLTALPAVILLSGSPGVGVESAAPTKVSRSEYVRVQDAKLYLLVRGADVAAPVLLWLHGGPGGAERPLFRYFNSGLEKHFVVGYWDQRGAGRSFDRGADPARLTVAQHHEKATVTSDPRRGRRLM